MKYIIKAVYNETMLQTFEFYAYTIRSAVELFEEHNQGWRVIGIEEDWVDS